MVAECDAALALVRKGPERQGLNADERGSLPLAPQLAHNA